MTEAIGDVKKRKATLAFIEIKRWKEAVRLLKDATHGLRGDGRFNYGEPSSMMAIHRGDLADRIEEFLSETDQ